MNTFSVIKLIFLLLVSFSVSYAQKPKFRFEHDWAKPSNQLVRLMLQDKKGFIWFGSDKLIKYAGNQFTSYKLDPSDSTSLSGTPVPVFALLEDTIGIGSHTGLHQLVLTPQGKGKPSKVSFIHYRHDTHNLHSLTSDHTTALAQPDVFRIDSLPKEGVVLTEGWKWYLGDDPAWADPGFDDSGWERMDPIGDIFALPQLPKSGQIGWFRIRLAVDTSINDQLVLMLEQSGASEIYLNGKMIRRFGVISNKPGQVRAFSPRGLPISFPVREGAVQLLSVRYALQPDISYGTHFGFQNLALKVTINTVEHAVDHYADAQTNGHSGNYLLRSVFGLMSLLFFTLFVFFPARKSNLYFAVYAFLEAISWILLLQSWLPSQVGIRYWILQGVLGLQAIAYLFMLTAVYHTLGQKRSGPYWLLVALGIISIPSGAFIYGWGWMVYGVVFTNLINIDIARIALIALQKNKKGAWIIVTGGICFLFGWTIFSLQFFEIYTIDMGINFFDVSILSIPIAFAIFLGYDFALTNRSLKQKLTEVQVLSAEKQQLLTTQNATLERQVGERTTELTHQKEELQSTLEHLKATQAQLVEQEKAGLENELKLERLKQEQELASYQSRMAELEMQALRAQMNPHFIFNSLNSINRFILKNESEAASDYLTKFSKLIRLILQNSQSHSVSLEQELQALRLYIDMEMLRFEGQFDYQISLDPDLEIEELEVPPLVIQPYVENAIWHGLMHRQDKGYLEIALGRKNGTLFCQITDDGVGRKRAAALKSKSASKNKSLGMQITAHRLELINALNDKATTVEVIDLVDSSGEACGTRVVLKIPV
jgi:hypothetical protein